VASEQARLPPEVMAVVAVRAEPAVALERAAVRQAPASPREPAGLMAEALMAVVAAVTRHVYVTRCSAWW
jgi:hypothetical protein